MLDLWPLFFLLATMEAAVALYVLLRIPSEGGGYSAARWSLILTLTGLIFAFISAAWFSWRKTGIRIRWLDPDSRPELYSFLTSAFPLLAIGAGIAAFLLRWWEPHRLLSSFERAWPLLAFAIVFSVQSTLWLLALRFGIHKAGFPARKPALFSFIIWLRSSSVSETNRLLSKGSLSPSFPI